MAVLSRLFHRAGSAALGGVRRLTPEPYAVVNHSGGHALVSAVAGSVKTEMLVWRIAELLDRGVEPARIDRFPQRRNTRKCGSGDGTSANCRSWLQASLAAGMDSLTVIDQELRPSESRHSTFACSGANRRPPRRIVRCCLRVIHLLLP